MRTGDSHAQRLGSVESSAANERQLHAKRVRACGESHLLWKSEAEKERTRGDGISISNVEAAPSSTIPAFTIPAPKRAASLLPQCR